MTGLIIVIYDVDNMLVRQPGRISGYAASAAGGV
jgi:hypothetical protein